MGVPASFGEVMGSWERPSYPGQIKTPALLAQIRFAVQMGKTTMQLLAIRMVKVYLPFVTPTELANLI